MFRTIAGGIIILGGIALAVISIRSYLKEANKSEGKEEFKKLLKFKHLFNVFTGVCMTILGIMAILALLNDDIIELASVSILLIDTIVERIIDKKVSGKKKSK